MFWKKAMKIRELEDRLVEIEHSLCPDITHDYYIIGRDVHSNDGGMSYESMTYYKCKKCKKVVTEWSPC